MTIKRIFSNIFSSVCHSGKTMNQTTDSSMIVDSCKFTLERDSTIFRDELLLALITKAYTYHLSLSMLNDVT